MHLYLHDQKVLVIAGHNIYELLSENDNGYLKKTQFMTLEISIAEARYWFVL